MSYTFEIGKCPQCGQRPDTITENVMVDTYLDYLDDGTFEISDRESYVCWDTCESVLNTEKQVRLECSDGHDWYTNYTYGDG